MRAALSVCVRVHAHTVFPILVPKRKHAIIKYLQQQQRRKLKMSSDSTDSSSAVCCINIQKTRQSKAKQSARREVVVIKCLT